MSFNSRDFKGFTFRGARQKSSQTKFYFLGY